MTIRPDLLLAHDFGEVRQSYDERDAILYALGLGLGADPTAVDDLAFLDETRLQVLPSFAVTLASPGMWMRDPRFGVAFNQLVHAAQDVTFGDKLPSAATIVGTARVAALGDRGAGRGAELVVEREVRGAADGRLHATIRQTLQLRGDGGFGGDAPVRAPLLIPDRSPDVVVDVQVSPRAALIYRLSGDRNPLHIDPDFARSAGFERPILHGLASYGIAGVAVARALGRTPDAVTRLACRFSDVVYPGDTLSFAIWQERAGARFVAHAGDRKVLDQGLLEVTQ